MRRLSTAVAGLATVALIACGGRTTAPPATTTTAPTTPSTTAPPATAPATTSTTTSTATTTPSTTTTTTTSVPTSTIPAGSQLVRVWFLLEERMVPVYRYAASETEAIAALLEPPRPDDIGRIDGLVTAIPHGSSVRSVSLADGTATVDLSRQFESGGGSLSMTARLAQLVYTATDIPGVDGVRLRLDGADVDSFGGEGIIVSTELRRRDFPEFKPRVIIDDPTPDATVTSPFRIAGSNTTFENTVALKVIDNSGRVLLSTFTTGRGPIYDTQGNPLWGPFEASVALDSIGTGSGIVVAYDTSAEDGHIVSWFAVAVRFSLALPSGLTGFATKSVSTPDTPGGPGITSALVDVRTGRHPGFERVVFEFANYLPGYFVHYVPPPITADPSDLPVDLLADGVLMVRMSSASGVDLAGEVFRETYTGPAHVGAGYPAVHEVVRVGDYEGVLQWAISTWTRPPFRVMTLNNPPRLIIDVASAAVI